MHEELVKALRCCVIDYNSIQSRLCNKCQYAKYADGKYGCENKLKADAASLIEDMMCEIEDLRVENKDLRYELNEAYNH